MGDIIVETLYSNRVTSANKRIRTPPLSPPFKVGVFVVSPKVARTSVQHCMEGMGEKKLYFTLLMSIKRKNALFREKCLKLILSPIVCIDLR